MSQTEDQEKQQKNLEETYHLSVEMRNELLSVDLTGINVPSAKIHPQWESLFQLTQQYVTAELGPEFKLSEDLCGMSFYVFPSLSFDLLRCILVYNMTGFVMDDHLDKCPDDIEKAIQHLRTKHCPGNKLYEKWLQFCMNVLQEVISEPTLDQLYDKVITSFSKTLEMSRLCTGQSTLSNKDFMNLRSVDAGCMQQFFFVLIGTRNQLTEELKNDQNYLGLNMEAALHATLVNDLYSLRKEIRDESYKCNYVYVKMTNGNISAQAAVNQIILEVDESEKMARMYGERLRQRNDPNLSRYVDGMYDAMAGNHYWSTICKRYN